MEISYNIPRLIISAPRGASGKTLFTLGLIRLLRERGFKVSAFKKGPDYIDAGWHSKVANNPCRNLDLFLFDEEHNLFSFYMGSKDTDLAIIEGNRGLFDGVDVEGSCSTASLSKILKTPVILVVDCSKATRSIAALVKGFVEFDKEVSIKGVILNHIARSRHENLIRLAIERYTEVPVLGVIPRLKEAVKERHLGLVTSWEQRLDFTEELVEKLRNNINLDSIIDIAKQTTSLWISPLNEQPERKFDVDIGVFYDSAFQFYYPENLDALSSLGARLIFINSLEQRSLPRVSALYLGGGFPELQGEFLADNISLRKEVKEAAESGMPIYAECGGLMYLGEEIEWNNKIYPMSGVLPIKFKVDKKPRGHGYVVAEVTTPNPYYEIGSIVKGHEFHYSYPVEIREKKGMRFAFQLERGSGLLEGVDGIIYKNVFAGYTHIHTFSVKYWAKNFLSLAERYKNKG
ncbi:MAG: hydrogenobyrinic acid a,c-diamide synthase (glutamine-hydrolyzing) [Caldimicrobium sp.]|nr:hydrogenobyrinic acid a,c-diamide synthase (glutamine-hydrolyzing) [Caldimicrobium sp.]MCX7873702.1 hydrogenobyrinic acid a,c-diamide synthase (glutamine-hydrolyzing) [Caldimicrobium sp.]MDW8093626.1 cobyrinate a,c-diamide synthase [Caldimicrobium sp.]